SPPLAVVGKLEALYLQRQRYSAAVVTAEGGSGI
ncbi:hypothetical protein ACO22_03335, partial [Paracoccidioides brasiliensis]